MRRATTLDCNQCHKPILAHELFARLKGPRAGTYQFFHYRIRAGDSREGHLKESK